MNKLYSIFLLLILSAFLSCKTQPDSNRHYLDNDPKRVYRLQLNPKAGAQYAYTITKETEFEVEVEGKKVDNKSRATMDVTYNIGKDSAGNVVLNMVYDKIHLYTKTGEQETDMDADKAEGSGDPAEKMLGLLKGAAIQAVVNPAGQIKSLKGFDEIKDKVMARFDPGDTYGRSMAGKQWDEQVKEGMVKNNMQQLFAIFPDSAVHVGDRWKLSSTQKEGIDLHSKSSFLLKEIVDGTAVIRSEGEISTDHSTGEMGGATFTADLKGKQEGEFAMETTTGMLLSSDINSSINGTMNMMGRDVPMTIRTSTKMQGRKLK
jgi:hypothetical protein